MILGARNPCNHHYLRHVLINFSHLCEQNHTNFSSVRYHVLGQINLECICKYRNGSMRFEIFIFVHIASIDFYLPGYIYIINGFLQIIHQIIFVIILLFKTNKIRIQPQTFAKKDPKRSQKINRGQVTGSSKILKQNLLEMCNE